MQKLTTNKQETEKGGSFTKAQQLNRKDQAVKPLAPIPHSCPVFSSAKPAGIEECREEKAMEECRERKQWKREGKKGIGECRKKKGMVDCRKIKGWKSEGEKSDGRV